MHQEDGNVVHGHLLWKIFRERLGKGTRWWLCHGRQVSGRMVVGCFGGQRYLRKLYSIERFFPTLARALPLFPNP
jgi:hypothetical protein